MSTNEEYDEAVKICREIFVKKAKDYGTSWRVLRSISIVDQLYIKARRIRHYQETGVQKIDEQIDGEFIGIVNYGVIALIQLSLTEEVPEELSAREAEKNYHQKISEAKALMLDKNHDYGEAWREMSQESFVDLILMKLNRVRQILKNKGKTLISEGIEANFTDIINYAIFALILIAEQKH